MALQSSGAISLSNIQTEFGGSAPTGLTEYYRGGSYVDATSNTTTIPASGTIRMSDFYGTSDAPDIVYAYPEVIYTNGNQTSNSNTGASWIRNGATTYDQGSGHIGTPWTPPSSMGVLSLTGQNQNMPFFSGWYANELSSMVIILPYKTTGMRDLDPGEAWIQDTILGLKVTYLNENWTSNYYNKVNNQGSLSARFISNYYPPYNSDS